MTPSAAVTFFFELVLLAGFALTSIRLYTSGLFRKYRYFFAYLIFSVFQVAAVLNMDVRSDIYQKFFVVTEPILWAFYVLLVMELYSLVLEKFKGLYTLGRWALYGSLVVSVVLSGLMMLPKLARATAKQRSSIMPYYIGIERGIICALLIFLFLMLLLLSRYPVHLSRNVIVHCAVYATFFLSGTLGLFLRSVMGLRVTQPLNTVFVGVSAACVLLWLIFLNKDGETRLVTLASLPPEQEERIMGALRSLNSTVLRAAQK